MSLNSLDITSPKFIEAVSHKKLAADMERMIIENNKKYDFYFFYTYTDRRGALKHVAVYREEISLDVNELTRNKNED